MEPYELLSYVLPIFIELLLNVCTTIIKLLIILTCIITTGIDLFIEIQCQHSNFCCTCNICGTVQLRCIENASTRITGLVYTTPAEAILIMMQQMISDHYMQHGIQQLIQAFSTLVILFFLLM